MQVPDLQTLPIELKLQIFNACTYREQCILRRVNREFASFAVDDYMTAPLNRLAVLPKNLAAHWPHMRTLRHVTPYPLSLAGLHNLQKLDIDIDFVWHNGALSFNNINIAQTLRWLTVRGNIGFLDLQLPNLRVLDISFCFVQRVNVSKCTAIRVLRWYNDVEFTCPEGGLTKLESATMIRVPRAPRIQLHTLQSLTIRRPLEPDIAQLDNIHPNPQPNSHPNNIHPKHKPQLHVLADPGFFKDHLISLQLIKIRKISLDAICQCINLINLKVVDCPTLNSLRGLHKLRYLKMRKCAILGWQDIEMTNLQSLTVSFCPRFTRVAPAPRLERLFLGQHDLQFDALRECPKLRCIRIWTPDSLAINLNYCVELRNLYINCHNMHYSLFKDCVNLEIIHLANMNGKQSLAGFLRLEKIDIENTRIDYRDLPQNIHFTTLKAYRA